ncbi:MAG: sigma-70 family RNA polymerase sigma factor [Phycisphaerales bacterium]|nr:sigma-70 family RNA polymerase sigma factor [Phycisphaerales bacterium]
MMGSILERIAGHEPGAVEALLDAYGDLVWSIVRRHISDDHQAEDLVQEIFTEIWTVARRYEPARSSEVAFVAMVAKRRTIDALRRLHRSEAGAAAPLDESTETPGELDRLLEALRHLSTEQQSVLRLAYGEGLTQREISRALQLPLGTVKAHARRGLARLAELLDEEDAS